MVTTKQKSIADTQKIKRKELKHTIKESQTTKEENKRKRKEQRNYKTARKQLPHNKHTHINNFFKCKWTKFSSKKK